MYSLPLHLQGHTALSVDPKGVEETREQWKQLNGNFLVQTEFVFFQSSAFRKATVPKFG